MAMYIGGEKVATHRAIQPIEEMSERIGEISTKVDEISSDIVGLAPKMVNDASGDLITLNDSSDDKLPVLTIYGNSTQDGTPTPTAPVPIESIGDGGSVEVASCGKNLLNLIHDGYINETDILINNTTYGERTSDFVVVESGKPYQLHMKGDTTNLMWYGIAIYDDDKKFIYRISKSIQNTVGEDKYYSENFIFKDNMKYIRVSYRSYGNVKVQIEQGTTATAYEPYKGSNLAITLPEPLRGIGDYRDKLTVYSDGSGVIERRICNKKVDINNCTWSNTYKRALYRLQNATTYESYVESKCLSDMFIKNLDVYFDGKRGGGVIAYASIIMFRVEDGESISNINDLITLLGADSFLVQYAQKTLTTEHLTPSQVQGFLQTYKPITNIYNSEGAEMEVEYVCDIKNYIDNKFTELQTALVSLGTV